MAERHITDAEKRFCEEYVANGYVGSKAVAVAYPNMKQTPKSLSDYGCKVLKRERVRNYIGELEKDIYEANRINAEHIANELATIAFGEVTDDSRLGYSDKMKALELLGKQLSLYTQKVDLNSAFTIDVKINEE